MNSAVASQCMQRPSYMQAAHQAYPTAHQQYSSAPPASYYSEYLPPMQLPTMMSGAPGSIPGSGPGMYSAHGLYQPRVTSNGHLSPQGSSPPHNGPSDLNTAEAWNKFDANKFQVL